ncbi:tetratricopeptide (TPR) repeat protein [Epilithonimonas hungarica]|uniref:tetratricopeptide repeat protein n=1 Tax=Epilithonimonas hungarica TaxID=454006 RepID=UPI0027877611|nr:hypothetical protein [Epilithonimonas hungarica]MDP9954429.1 tetratricopeptide (TPR) repeat protein [Epilithonimonas hungarica]
MMKYRLSFYLLFLFTLFFSQENKPYFDAHLQQLRDSLETLAAKNPQLGLIKADQLIKISKNNKNPYYEAKAMYVRDFIYCNTDDYKSLLKNVDQTIELSKKQNLYVTTFGSSLRKAVGLMHLGFFSEAKKVLDDSYPLLNILSEKKEYTMIGSYWNDYGDFYNMQKNDKKAIEMFNKAILSFQKVEDAAARNTHLITIYTNIGNNYLYESKVDSAFTYFKYAKALFPVAKYKDNRIEATILYGFGMGYNIKKEYQQAIPYFIKSLELCRKNDYQDIFIENLKQLSISYKNVKVDKNDPNYKNFIAASKEYYDKNKFTAKELEQIKENNSIFYERNKYYIWSVSGFLLIGFLGITFYQVKKQKKSEEEKIEISEVVKEQSEEISSLKTKVNEGFEEVLELAKTNDPSFMKRFSEVYPDFIRILADKYPKLTYTQLKILAYSFLNFKTKDIASYMNIAVRTVDTHKYRIRKIIDIDPEEDLIFWCQKKMTAI